MKRNKVVGNHLKLNDFRTEEWRFRKDHLGCCLF